MKPTINQIMKPTINQIMADPTASYWLKNALNSVLKRDILDALNDVEVLHEILQDAYDRITSLRRNNL